MQKDVSKVMAAMLADDTLVRATRYLSPRLVVRATRRRYGRARRAVRGVTEILVTIGKPNHRERAFIRDAKRAGEPFPVKKTQLQYGRRS